MINLSGNEGGYLLSLLRQRDAIVTDDIDERFLEIADNNGTKQAAVPTIEQDLDELMVIASIVKAIEFSYLPDTDANTLEAEIEKIQGRHEKDMEYIEKKRRELKEIIG